MFTHDIVFIAVEPFEHYTWRRRHHVAWRLAQRNRVLWIAPPIISIGLFFRKHYNLTYYSVKTLFDLGRLKYQRRNLWVYCPVQPFPTWSKIPAIAELNKRFVLWDVRRVAKKLAFQDPILWLYKNKCDYDYLGLFNEKLVVYDSYDKQTANIGFDQGEAWMDSIFAWENHSIRMAGIVFAVSQGLYEDARKINENSHLIQNGVDWDLFEKSSEPVNLHISKGVKRPILAYLGLLHYMVDFDLLMYIAKKRPEWSILLVGKEQIKVARDKSLFISLTKMKNVFYIGEIPKEQIPSYLNETDVCIAPMKKIDLNKYADPLKLWEYLAAGKPVVATDQGTKYYHTNLIRIASNKEDFVESIETALREETPQLVLRRKKTARENSWDRRVERMIELLEAEFARPSASVRNCRDANK